MILPNEGRKQSVMIRQIVPIHEAKCFKEYVRKEMASKVGLFLIEKGLMSVKEVYGSVPGCVEFEMSLDVIVPE